MDENEVMAQLAALGNTSRKKVMLKAGAGENCFGVRLGELRKLAAKLGQDNRLALDLWETGNGDARLLACMIVKPETLPENTARELTAAADWLDLLDELVLGPLCATGYAGKLMREWIDASDDNLGRAGWALAVGAVMEKKASPQFLTELLDIVERELKDASPNKQWMMNRALCEIGIRHDAYTQRCLAIGERLGVYRDMKVPKGCTSAYAPEWIAAGRKLRGK